MGTLVATGDAPQWPARNWPGSSQPLNWLLLAVLVHITVLWWLGKLPLPAPVRSSALEVQLLSPRPAAPPEPQNPVAPPAQPLPAPVLETTPEMPPATKAEAVTPPLPSPRPVQQPPETEPSSTVPTSVPAPSQPGAEELLSRISRYRLDGQSQLEAAPAAPLPTPVLGLANQTNMLTSLARPLPELPFEPGEMGLNFYPAGIRGDIARGFDKITPEFGFVTSFGLEIKCKYVLVIVSCGWDERR